MILAAAIATALVIPIEREAGPDWPHEPLSLAEMAQLYGLEPGIEWGSPSFSRSTRLVPMMPCMSIVTGETPDECRLPPVSAYDCPKPCITDAPGAPLTAIFPPPLWGYPPGAPSGVWWPAGAPWWQDGGGCCGRDDDEPEPAPVPVPASWLLMLGALVMTVRR